MRTVTFAKLDVIAELKDHFVLLWHNQNPGLFPRGKQQPATEQQARAYPQGGGGGNVRTYFCTPDGRVAYHLQGYWRGKRYLTEARFARGLVKRIARLPEAEQAKVIQEALNGRIQTAQAECEELGRKYPEEFKKKVYESEVRKRAAALVLLQRTLGASRELAAKPVQPVLISLVRALQAPIV